MLLLDSIIEDELLASEIKPLREFYLAIRIDGLASTDNGTGHDRIPLTSTPAVLRIPIVATGVSTLRNKSETFTSHRRFGNFIAKKNVHPIFLRRRARSLTNLSVKKGSARAVDRIQTHF